MTLRFVEAFVFCSANFLTQPTGFRPRPHRSALAGRRWPPLAAPGRAPAPAGRPCPPRRPSYQEARHVHSTQQQGAISLQIICPLSLASLHKVQVWFQGRSFPDTGHVLTLGLPHRLGELARLRAPGAIWRDGAEVAAGAPARSRPGAVHHGGRDGKRGGVQDFGEQPAG